MDALGHHRALPAHVWLRACRPKTLTLAVVPVVVGTAWAMLVAGGARLDVLVVAIFAAIAIQIGTNLWNDALDAEHGLDAGERLGPRRATASGWLSARAVRCAAAAAFVGAAAAGLVLVQIGGWPILAIGIAAIACGLLYSAGPLPISATPLGEVLVLAFFGVAGVAGTVLLHGATVSLAVLALGVFTGLPAASVLLVNNHRDRVSDARGGRQTLAIHLGPAATVRVYKVLVTASALGPVVVRPACVGGWLATALLLLLALPLARSFEATPVGPVLNRALTRTARFQMVQAFAFVLVLAVCA